MYKLKKKHIPTPLIAERDRAPVEIAPLRRGNLRGFRISWQLLVWAVRMLWIVVTMRDQQERDRALGYATRVLMESLGYLWIKAGQLVSVREDLLSQEFAAQLAGLQGRAIGFPPELARRAIETELGGPIERFFDDFEDLPLASASIAQVHRARLKNGDVVVVKVLRPGSEEVFRSDMAFFSGVATWVSRLNMLEWLNLEEVIWELDQMMREEVDLRYELNNIKVMRKQLRRHKIYIPRPYAKYSTRRILVMEYLPGVLMSDFIRIRNEDPARSEEWLCANNIDVKRVGRRLYLSFLRQMFEDNQIHGDLHPGNMMFLRNSRFAFIDLGTITSIERALLIKYTFLSKAISRHEFDKAVDLMLSLVPQLPAVDLQPVREDMIRALRAWVIRTPIKSIPYREKSLTQGVVDVLRIMAAQRIMITWSFLRVIRSRGNMDHSMNYLVPGMDQPKLYRRYFRDRRRRFYRQLTRPGFVRRTIVSVIDTVSELRLFLDPLVRRASRLFTGSTSKLADIAQVVFETLARATLAGVLVAIPLYIQAFYPGLVERVPWLLRFLYQVPVSLSVSHWMSQYSATVWLFALGVAGYLWLRMRALAKLMAEEEIRLPDNDRTR